MSRTIVDIRTEEIVEVYMGLYTVEMSKAE